MFALFTIIKKVIFKKNGYHNQNIKDSLYFSLTEILIFSRKKALGPKDWDNNCNRYSNLTALYKTISANAFLISINSDNTISFQNVLCHTKV